MFGLEILDVILGLAFVYLLLSLICSAINEYLASMLNKRGRVLVDGLATLLKDTGLDAEFFDHPLISTTFPHHGTIAKRAETLKKWPWGTRWIYRFFTWAFKPKVREARYPSYLSARSFATAFLEISESLGVLDPTGARAPGSTVPPGTSAPGTATGTGTATVAATGEGDDGEAGKTLSGSTPVKPQDTPTGPAAASLAKLQNLLATLERDAAADVAPYPNLALLQHVGSSVLPDDVKRKIADAALAERDRLQKLQASTEVWFNNSMDRVSGAYKRHTQHVLFFVGLVVAFALNADTIDLWRRLSTDDALRNTLATQAANEMPQLARLAARSSTPSADTTRSSAPASPAPAPATPPDAPVVPPPAPAPAPDPGANQPDSGAAGGAGEGTSGNPALQDAVRLSLNASETGKSEKTGWLVQTATAAVDTGAAADSMSKAVAGDSLSQAKAVYDSATALLGRTTLNLGWSVGDLQALGIATQLDSAAANTVQAARIAADSAKAVANLDSAERARTPKADSLAGVKARKDNPRRTYLLHGPRHWHGWPLVAKLLGLVLTAFALSLGAPFWFDTLNKIINVRAAGRAPTTTPAPTPAEGANKGDGKK
ncbi:MAG TPA: hypothetical protein VF541_17890 [Longimicrobium sp.]|jgi:hypothetical protein